MTSPSDQLHPTITLLPGDADAAAVTAHLATRPEWARYATEGGCDIYRHGGSSWLTIRVPVEESAAYPDTDLRDAINKVNAVTLGLPATIDEDVLARFVAIVSYHQPAPESPVCRCGLTAPCPTARLATGKDTPR
ncbi:hypothetical protein [Streptosporangium sp. NPDC048865]|uniref:hypothetical protein n=1 Tax=Streptosporangium sp. NPDC048865 TaxID=3155766 RepID=UPI0034478178